MNAVTDPVERAIDRFKAAREGARRFHRDAIGDVDPAHCFGDFLCAVGKARRGESSARARLDKEYGVEKAALSETSGGGGGYTVPVEFREELMRDVADVAVVRPRCLVTTQDTLTQLIPMPGADIAAPSGASPFYGGFQARIVAENAAWAESEPEFEQVELTAAVIGGYVVGSNTWLADSRGTDAWLRRLFAESLAWYEDAFCLNASPPGAAGGPQGIAGAPATVVVTRQTTVTFTLTDAQNMLTSHHRLSSVELSDWERGDGKSTVLWVMNRAAALPMTQFTNWFPNGPFELYGMPVALTTKQPKLGTQGDVLLCDLAFYCLSDRQAYQVDFSPHDPTPYLKNQSSWRIYNRIGGAPLLGGPITLTDGSSNTVSPFVALSTK